MPRRKKVEPLPTKFFRFPEITIDGFVIEKGDTIKIKDEWGTKFKFDSLVTNKETGAQWVDCFEMWRGRTGCLRAFRLERVKRIPKRGKRGRRKAASTAS